MLKTFNLGTKFTSLLLLVFILGSCLGGAILSNLLQKQAQSHITAKGLVLMETITSVRDYTNQQVRPLLEGSLRPDQFFPETVPAYSARRVVENLHKSNPEYTDLIYKEAMLNPTNPQDQSDPFEAGLIQQFRGNQTLKELSGFRSLENQDVFYSARPIVVTDATCLRCHSTPDAAPATMLAIYGKKNGFNWPLNAAIGTQVVYVPTTQVFQASRQAFLSVMGIFVGLFAIATLLINLLLKPTVLRPVQHLARLAQRLGTGDLQFVTKDAQQQEIETRKLAKIATRTDELGQLAQVFQGMVREVLAREQQLRQKIRELRIEIDTTRRSREVAEITDSDYFQDIQKKAKKLKNQTQDEA